MHPYLIYILHIVFNLAASRSRRLESHLAHLCSFFYGRSVCSCVRPYITITRSQRATREEREERERDGEILHVFLSRSPPPPIITGIICLLARQTLKKTSNNTKNIAYFELCFLRLFLFETQRDITYAFQNKKGTAHGAETFCAVLSLSLIHI